MIAWNKNDRTTDSTQLALDESDVVVLDAIVIKEVTDDKKQIDLLLLNDVDDIGERLFGSVPEGRIRFATYPAVQVDIGCVDKT